MTEHVSYSGKLVDYDTESTLLRIRGYAEKLEEEAAVEKREVEYTARVQMGKSATMKDLDELRELCGAPREATLSFEKENWDDYAVFVWVE